jgi:hypothetical protein
MLTLLPFDRAPFHILYLPRFGVAYLFSKPHKYTRTDLFWRSANLSPVPLLFLFSLHDSKPKRGLLLSPLFDFKTAFLQSELPRCCVGTDLDVA